MSNHDELMSNFFAQPDALAEGFTPDDSVAEALRPHKHFTGNRPSLSILFEGSLTPFACGQLLGLYEHRVATEGFIYDINSFDQFGVELGKVLAKNARAVFAKAQESGAASVSLEGFNKSSQALMKVYLNHN